MMGLTGWLFESLEFKRKIPKEDIPHWVEMFQ